MCEAVPRLPLQIDDASRAEDDTQYPNQDTRLNHRILDLRAEANQAIFKMQVKHVYYLNEKERLSCETPHLFTTISLVLWTDLDVIRSIFSPFIELTDVTYIFFESFPSLYVCLVQHTATYTILLCLVGSMFSVS